MHPPTPILRNFERVLITAAQKKVFRKVCVKSCKFLQSDFVNCFVFLRKTTMSSWTLRKLFEAVLLFLEESFRVIIWSFQRPSLNLNFKKKRVVVSGRFSASSVDNRCDWSGFHILWNKSKTFVVLYFLKAMHKSSADLWKINVEVFFKNLDFLIPRNVVAFCVLIWRLWES